MIKKRMILKHILPWLERDEIIIISGPRRVGKTTTLTLIKNELLSRGINEDNIFLFNLEDLDILKELNKSPKELLKHIINKSKKNYFFIDEIQYLDEPTNFMKYLYDLHKDKIKLIVTGSFLFEFKGQFKDTLVGRKVGFDLTPLTFQEYIDFKNTDLLPYYDKNNVPESRKTEFLNLLEEYLIFGGMPEIVLTDDREIKKTLLKEYVSTYLKKDIRYVSGSNDVLRYNDLLSIIANQISGLLNKEEICNTLGMTRNKVEKYLTNFILSSLVYLLPPYYTNIRTQISKMKKVFLFDTGIRNQIIYNFNSTNNRNDAGALFENFILNELINSVGLESIYFYRTKMKTEIDFIIKTNEIVPVEIKYKKLKSAVGLRAIVHFINKNNIKRGFLVNLTLNKKMVNQNIEVIDYLKFLNILKQFRNE
ncbi:MAG: ATP-binding protein [bacterium]